MANLEGINNHLVIIDVEVNTNESRRVINIYRSFNPHEVSPATSFLNQLNVCGDSFNKNTVLIGDFNLNENKKHKQYYLGIYISFKQKKHTH